MPYLPITFNNSQRNELSINEAAEFFGVSTKTLRRWEEKGVLQPARTLGGHRRYSLEVLKRFKESKGTKRLRPSVKTIISQTRPKAPKIASEKPQIPEIYQKSPSPREYFASLHQIQKRILIGMTTLLAFSTLVYGITRIETVKEKLHEPASKLAGFVIEKIGYDTVPEEELRTKVLGIALDTQIFKVNVESLFSDVATFDGDVAVNSGNLVTSSDTFNFVNTSALTLNIGGEATEVNIGAGTGTTTVGNDLAVPGNLDVNGEADIPTLIIGGDTFTDLTGTGLTVSANTLQTTLGTSIDSGEIVDETIKEVDLNVSNSPTSGFALTYNSGTSGFTWTDLASSNLFTDAGTVVYLTTTTDSLTIGSSSELAKLAVDGDTDEIQLLVQGNSSQTANLFVIENSGGTDLFRINSSGQIISGSSLVTLTTTTGALDADAIGLISSDGVGGTSSGSGLETDTDRLGLIQGCGNGQILKWNDGSNIWECANDSGASSAIINVESIDVPVGTNVDTLDFRADFTLTASPSNEVNIEIADDILNFTEFSDALSLDAATTIANPLADGNNFAINLTSTGDFVIQDGGSPFVTFSDIGGVAFDPTTLADVVFTTDNAAGSFINITGLASGTGSSLCVDGSNNVITCSAGSGSDLWTLSGNTIYPDLSIYRVGVGTATSAEIISSFYVTRTLADGATGKALAIFNQTENQDILTASASGTTVANLTRAGNLQIEGTISDLSGATLIVDDDLQVNGNDILSSSATALTLSGSDVTVVGDLTVSGGDIIGTATTNLLNVTSTTVNFAGAATTLNLADAAITGTIDIGGVTADGATTLNLATNATTGDTITIGNSAAGTTLALTGGDAWNISTAGVLTLSADSAQVTGIVATDTDYTNALSVGDNNITGTTYSLVGTAATIDFSEFDVSPTSGAVTINDDADAGNISIEGTTLDINSLDFIGVGSLTTGGTNDLTLNPGGGDVIIADSDNLSIYGVSIGLNNDADSDNLIALSAAAGAPSGSLFWGDRTLCDSSGNCAGGAGGSKWQRNGTVLAPLTATDEVVLGGNTSTVFQFEVNGSQVGKALVSLNETGDQNILTASASGTTVAQLDRSGQLILNRTTANADRIAIIAGNTGAGTFTGTITQTDLTGNQIYTLPNSAGDFCLSSGNCSGTAGGSKWTDSGTTTYLTDTTDDLVVGDSTPTAAGEKISFQGDEDEILLLLQGHSTQTSNLILVEQNGGTDLLTLSNAGLLTSSDLTLGLNDTSATISTQDTNEDLTIDPNGTGNITLTAPTVTLSGTTTLTSSSLATFTTSASLAMTSTTTLTLGTAATVASNGTTLTLDAVTDIQLDADGSDILFLDGGTTFATFTNSGTDLTIDVAGGNLLLSDNDVLNVGGAAAGAFNFFAGSTAGNATADSDNDLYIEDKLEVDGGVTLSPSSTADINVVTDADSFLNISGLTSAAGSGLCVDVSNNVITCSAGSGSDLWTLSGSVIFPDLASYNVLVGSVTAGDAIGNFTVTGTETGKALAVFNDTGTDQNIITASASGTTVANLNRSGDLAIEGQLSDLSTATLTVNDALSVLGALTVTGVVSDSDSNLILDDTVDIGSATTGVNVTTAGVISDIDGNLVLDDQTDIGSAATGLRVTTAGQLTDIDGTAVSIDDDISFVDAQSIITTTGDLTLDPADEVVLGDTDTFIVGGHAGNVAYNVISDSGGSPVSGQINSDDDLFVEGVVEASALYQGANQVCDTSGNCAGTTNYWRLTTGNISPGNAAGNSDRVVLGGNSTTPFQFEVNGKQTGKALVSLTETGDQNILTASSSAATTVFNLTRTGLVQAADLTLGLNDTSATISTQDTNEDLTIDPNGTGAIILTATTGLNITSGGLISDLDATAVSIDDDLSFVGAQAILTTAGGNLSFTPDTTGDVVVSSDADTLFSLDSTVANADTFNLEPNNSGAATFVGTLTTADLTGNQTWTLPDATGNVCLSTGNCAGTTNYWQLNANVIAPGNAALVTDRVAIGGLTTTDFYLGVSGARVGKALVGLNETGDQNILTASASGTTVLNLSRAGLLTTADLTLGLNDTSATISTQDTNEDLTIDPNGTGAIILTATTGLNITSGGLISDLDGTAVSIDDDISFVDAQSIITTTGDLTLDPADEVVLGDTDTIIIGGHAGNVAYNVISDSGGSPGGANINSDDDLFIEGALEVDSTLYADGGIDTTFTAGSVVFAGTSGVLAEDNTNFFWDDTANKLGIGLTPVGKLDVSGAVTGKALTILNETGDQAILTASASGTTVMTLGRTGNLTLTDSGSSNIDFNLSSSGDFTISDAGTPFVTFSDIGGITFDPTTSADVTFTTDNAAGSFISITGLASGSGSSLCVDGSNNVVTCSAGSGSDVWTLSGSVIYPDLISYNVLVGSVTAGDAIGNFTVTGAETGKALTVLNETGDQDILVASVSGTNRVRLTNAGNLIFNQNSSIQATNASLTIDVATAGDVTIGPPTSLASTDDLYFQDGNVTAAIPFSDTATSLNTTAQAIVDAINEAFDAGVGGGSGLWSTSNNAIYPTASQRRLGIGTNSSSTIISSLYIQNATSASGKALVVFNEIGDQNILTASASGTTQLNLTRTGTIEVGDLTLGLDDASATISTYDTNENLLVSANGTGVITIDPAGAGSIALGSVDVTSISFTTDNNAANDFSFAGGATFNDDVTLTLAETENLMITNTVTGTNSVDLLTMTLTDQTSSGTQRGLVITKAATTDATTESLIALDNAETTANLLTDYIIITKAATGPDTTTDAIDVSDADLFNGINLGSNFALFDGVRVFSPSTGRLTIEDTSGNDFSYINSSGASGGIVAIDISTSAPPTCSEGEIYTNDTDGNIYYCQSTDSWVDLTLGGGAASGWTDDGTTVRLDTPTDFVAIGANTADGKLGVTGARTGQALVIFNETGDQNIISASASGTTQFNLTRTGTIEAGDLTLGLDDTSATITTFDTEDITIDPLGGNILSSDALNIGGAAEAAYNFFATSTSGNTIADGVSDLYIQDEFEVDGTARFEGQTDWVLTSSEVVNITNSTDIVDGGLLGINVTTTTANTNVDALRINLTNLNDSNANESFRGIYIITDNDGTTADDTVYGINIENSSSSTADLDAGLYINNADTAQAITDAILIQSTGGGAITTGLDFDDTDIVTDIEFQNGETLDNNTDSIFTFATNTANADRLTLSPNVTGSAATFTGTITSADLTADRTWTFPNDTGNVCLSTGNCAGTTNYWQLNTNVLAPGNAAAVTDRVAIGGLTTTDFYLGVSGARVGKALVGLNETGDQAVFVASVSGTRRFLIDNTGSVRISPSAAGIALRIDDTSGNDHFTFDNSSATLCAGLFCSNSGIIKGGYGLTLQSRDNSTGAVYLKGSTDVTNDLGGIQFQVGGVEKGRFSNTGNLGIGVTAPDAKLQVSAAVTGKALTILNETGDQNILVASASGTSVFTLARTGGISILGSPATAIDLSAATTTTDIILDDGLTISQTSDLDLDLVEGGLTLNYDFGETTASTITQSSASNLEFESTAATGNAILLETTNAAAGIDITTASTTVDALDLTFNSLTTANGIDLNVNALTSGQGLNLQSTSASITSANLIKAGHTATYTADAIVSGNGLNLSRSLTTNTSGSSAVLFDAASSSSGSSVSSLTWSHTTGSGPNRVLIVGVSLGSNVTVSSVTYNTVALTSVGSAVNSAKIEIFRLVNPASGTYDVVVTLGSSSGIVGGATSWTGVDQNTPTGTFASATGSSTAPSVNVTSATNEVVVDTVATLGVSTLTVGGGQTQRWNIQIPGWTTGVGSDEAGATSVTMSWTAAPSATWAIGGVSLKTTAASLAIIGPLAKLASNCTITVGACTDTSNILQLEQQYANATGSVLNVLSRQTASGGLNLVTVGAGAATTLAGTLTGINLDLNASYVSTNQSATGVNILLDTASNTSGTVNYKGLNISGGLLNQSTGGTTTFTGLDVTTPAITQTAGTLSANGLRVTTGNITTAGTQNAINLDLSASDITTAGTVNGLNIAGRSSETVGTINGINIGTITAGAATEIALNIGSGWDNAIKVADTTSTANTMVSLAASSASQTTEKFLDIAQTGVAAGYTGNLINISTSSTTGAATFLNLAADSSTVGTLAKFSGNALTTGTGLGISSSSTGITTAATNTGSLFDITESGAMTAMTGSIASINASGANSVGSTGNLLNLNIAGTGQIMKALNITDATTGALANGAVRINMTGAHTGNAFQIDDVTATGTLAAFNTNSLTTGYNLNLSSTSTVLTTGRLLNLDWSPGSTTTATGDLFRLNIGPNGNVTNLFNVTDNGSTLFRVGESQIESAVPHSFTAAGDVTMAYDLLFTNQTSSFIKSNAPLTIEAGESFENNNLTLKTFGTGILNFETSGLKLFDTSANLLFDIKDIATNFGAAVTAGAFISNNSYYGEEFTDDILAATTADTASAGDNLTWYADTTGTTWTISQGGGRVNGTLRAVSTNTAINTILFGFGAAQNTLHSIFLKANLPAVQMKFMTNNSAGTTNDYVVGISDQATAVATDNTLPANGIYFTNNNTGSWVGQVRSASATVGTTSACGTISTTGFAVMRIEVVDASTVRFLLDPDASNGIAFTDCGTVSGAGPTAALGASVYVVQADAANDPTIDLDYFRVWQDDASPPVDIASASNSIALAAPISAQLGDVKLDLDSQNPGYQTLTDKNGNVIDKLSGFVSLISGNVKAGYAEVASLVSPSIQTKLISPLPDSDLVIDLSTQDGTGSGQDSTGGQSGFGKLLVKGVGGQTVFGVDAFGNATASGELASDSLVTNNASIAGTLRAEKIYADEIISKSNVTSQQSIVTREEIEAMLAEAEADQGLLTQAQNWQFSTATGSAALNELALENLFVTGTAAMDTLSLSSALTVGNDLVISSIVNSQLSNVNSIDTLTAPLSIQSSGAQPLYLMAGLVQIDTQGNVTIAGNLAVAGDITASGLTLKSQYTTYDIQNSESGFGKLLALYNSQGAEVASITATGAATFASLLTDKITLADDPTATSSGTFAGLVYKSSATAGTARVPTGANEVIIRNPNITSDSLVFVTPTSSTANPLFIKEQAEGEIKVGFDVPTVSDVSFNWWIVELTAAR